VSKAEASQNHPGARGGVSPSRPPTGEATVAVSPGLRLPIRPSGRSATDPRQVEVTSLASDGRPFRLVLARPRRPPGWENANRSSRAPIAPQIAPQTVPPVVLATVPRRVQLEDKAQTGASEPGPPGRPPAALAEIVHGHPRVATRAGAKASAPGRKAGRARNQRSPHAATAHHPRVAAPGLRRAAGRHLPPLEFRAPGEQDRLPAGRLGPASRVADPAAALVRGVDRDRGAGLGREVDRGPASKANPAGAAPVVVRTAGVGARAASEANARRLANSLTRF